ncbi:MAG: protoporphyrinogen oxidase [Acidimicrobiales bacterium]
MSPGRRPLVAVVGGGIAGLAAAWELTVAGGDGRRAPEVQVFEADGRVGGKLCATEFAGRTVDLAADAFLARRPEATDLCDELGLTGSLVPVGASGASLWARGRLRPMPAGLNLGVPTRWWPLARSGILSPAESLRVARDLLPFHAGGTAVPGDRSVGDIVGSRLGRPVVERLADPLIGGINAGGVDDLSAAATFPLLIAADHQPGSLMRRLRTSPGRRAATSDGAAAAPLFWSLAGSTASLATELTRALAGRGVTVHTGVPVEAVERVATAGPDVPRWRLDLGGEGPRTASADGIVLALPAGPAAVLLAPIAPRAAGMLSTIEYASVAVVTMTFPPEAIRSPLRGTGFLVPRTGTIGGQPALVTGATYLGRKWPHLARPGDELVRVSVGRFGDVRPATMDDDEVVAVVVAELGALLEIGAPPQESLVTRWDDAFPQYGVGHLVRVGRIEQELTGVGGVAVAGAALRGVGIPACIGSGRAAARRVIEALDGGSRPSNGTTPPPHPTT